MLEELHAKLSTIENTTRVVVISAKGPVFCSGHDLKEINSHNKDKEYFDKLLKLCSDTMVKIANLPVPVICQAHGVATAAGCQLVATCDLAVADSKTKFATPGVHIGLFCSTPSVAVLRGMSSRKKANHMLYTGDMITAKEALEAGLISQIIATNENVFHFSILV